MVVGVLEPVDIVTYFPKITKENWMDITKEWIQDTDFDDLFDMAEDDHCLCMSFKDINELI